MCDNAVLDLDDLRVVAEHLAGPCRFDHHGYCQNHALTDGRDDRCAIGRFVDAMASGPHWIFIPDEMQV